MKPSFIVIGLFVIATTPARSWAEMATLQHDPFQKPLRLQPKTTQPIAVNTAKPQVSEFDLSKLKLTAVLQAGNNSMVILAGKTLQLGDMFAGYRLLAVEERSAVFMKDQQQTVLTIDQANVEQ